MDAMWNSMPRSGSSRVTLDAILALARTAQSVRRGLTRVLSGEAEETELFLLWACSVHAPAPPTQVELARRLGISPAQVSGWVERLRKAGQLRTERSSTDRRRQNCRATELGEERLEGLLRLVEPVALIASDRLGVVDWASAEASLDAIADGDSPERMSDDRRDTGMERRAA